METEVKTENKRIDWIDIAKGYGICLVIIAHMLEICPFRLWIYTFHMPLFFFLSGYVFSTKYSFQEFLKRKVRSILIPYFSLGMGIVLACCLFDGLQGANFSQSFLYYLSGLLIQERTWTLWYIACLFWLNIIFYWIVKLVKNIYGVLAVSVGMFCLGLLYYHLGGGSLPWNVDVCFTSVLFFAVGFWFKLNYESFKEKISRTKAMVIFVVLLITNIVCGFAGIWIAGCGMEMYDSTYGFPPLTILSAFAGIFCVVILSHLFCFKHMRALGRNSLVFYAWHQRIMLPIAEDILIAVGILHENMSIPAYLFELILEFSLIMIFCMICHLIIANTKLRFMIGR